MSSQAFGIAGCGNKSALAVMKEPIDPRTLLLV